MVFVSLDRREVELPAGRCVDFEDLEHIVGQVAQRMRHVGGDVDDLIGADGVGLAAGGENLLAVAYDIDVVRLRVAMQAPARPARHQAIEMQIDLFGSEARIDELDGLPVGTLEFFQPSGQLIA